MKSVSTTKKSTTTFGRNIMSLDKAIQHGKEHRKPYRKSNKHDATCRPHGGCSYCRNNRLHSHNRRKQIAEDEINLFLKDS